MKFRYSAGVIVIALGTWALWHARTLEPSRGESQGSGRMPVVDHRPHADTSPATSPETGEVNSRAMDWLVAAAKSNQQLSPSDIQTLLAFISAPKPGNLTDGEWEERVNGILNLLRRQEVSSVQFQVFSGGDAGSWASSGAGSLGAAGPPRPAVPGLTEVLLEMAERNPSKVLRLYAMQHLSLWFEAERDPAKRRAMVGLLEKLATTPGDETAGCAVMMLADMRRRETQDCKTQDPRQEGASLLAGSGPRAVTSAPTGASATSSPPRFDSATDGIDWERVDRTLERASRRLVGEAGAGVDVRISAIHSCVDRRDAGVLAELRGIAADATQVTTLRKAAIHGIGQLGTTEDLALLDSLLQDDTHLSQALVPAKQSLSLRYAANR